MHYPTPPVQQPGERLCAPLGVSLEPIQQVKRHLCYKYTIRKHIHPPAALTLWCNKGFKCFAGESEKLMGRQLPWLRASWQSAKQGWPKELHRGARGYTAQAGVGDTFTGTRCVHVSEGVKGAHSWDAQRGGQKEEKSRSFRGKNGHRGECGNVTTHSSFLGNTLPQ